MCVSRIPHSRTKFLTEERDTRARAIAMIAPQTRGLRLLSSNYFIPRCGVVPFRLAFLECGLGAAEFSDSALAPNSVNLKFSWRQGRPYYQRSP